VIPCRKTRFCVLTDRRAELAEAMILEIGGPRDCDRTAHGNAFVAHLTRATNLTNYDPEQGKSK